MATATITNTVSCNGFADGEITAEVSSGTPPYQYQLNDGPIQVSPIFDNLIAGNYSLAGMDADGFEFVIPNLDISDPAAILLATTVMDNDIVVTASGGIGTLTYSIDGNNFQADNTFPDLADGLYTIWVKDEADCVRSMEVIVSNTVMSGSLQLVDSLSCFGFENASVIATITGGAIPYEFTLDGENYQDSNLFEGLPAGDYTVTVRDAIGNFFETNTVNISEPPAFTLTLEVMTDSILGMPSGGTPPYEYVLNGSNMQTDPLFTNLPPDNYQLLAIDANGCEATAQGNVLVNTNDNLFANGKIALYPNPGEGPFALVFPEAIPADWRFMMYNKLGQLVQTQTLKQGTQQLTIQRQNLAAGVYQLLISDGQRYQGIRLVIQ